MTDFFVTGGKTESSFFKIQSLWSFGLLTTGIAFESPIVKEFIANDRTKFDLVISEQFQQEAFNMFAHKYNCPLIVIGTLDFSNFMDQAKGALTPFSHVPHTLSYFSDRMSFLERVQNAVISLFDALGRKFYYLPKQTELAREAFKALENQQGGRLPSIEDLEKKISVHLMNSHPAFGFPRPKMPGLVGIAGVHIRNPKPLPENIKTFLDGAKDGVIYISFGSFLRSSEMPKDKYEAMLNTFRKLKQRVLWKWESEEIPDLPANVMVQKWLPQSDVLAHKNIKLFITHGGLFGSQEAVFNGVPMVLFPFYGDQHLNGVRMQERGICLMQAMSEMTSESLLKAITTVTGNHTYYHNVKKISEIFRSNQNSPLDTAVWWIEYVIRFKGADHLQSPAKNLPWFRYLMLDIVFVICGAIYVIYDGVKGLFNKADKKKNERTKKSETQKAETEKETNTSKVKNKNKNKKKD
jgi:glucuronosyltransferase